MQRGQIALEYMALLVVLLVALIPLAHYAGNTASSQLQGNQATDLVNTLAQAADSTTIFGAGTVRYQWIVMPSGVRSLTLDGNSIALELALFDNTTTIEAVTSANITGSLPLTPGRYRVALTKQANGQVTLS